MISLPLSILNVIELKLIRHINKSRVDKDQIIVEKELQKNSKKFAFDDEISKESLQSSICKQFPFIEDIQIHKNRLTNNNDEDPITLIIDNISSNTNILDLLSDTMYRFAGIFVEIQNYNIIFCVIFAKINKRTLDQVCNNVLNEIANDTEANFETILQVCNDIRFELRIKSIGIQQDTQKFLEDFVLDYDQDKTALTKIKSFSRQYNGNFVMIHRINLQSIKTAFETLLQNGYFINILLSNARDAGLTLQPPSNMYMITSNYQTLNRSIDESDKINISGEIVDSPTRKPKKSRIPISPPKGGSPRDKKRKILVKPPDDDSSSSSSSSRKKQIQSAQEQIENEPQITPPLIAESPAFIKPSVFQDPEMAKLIQQQKQLQNEILVNNNCPFDDVSDDDLVVPSDSKQALEQRKLCERIGIQATYDIPPFLVEGDNDDLDDLVIPSEAIEFLKQKGLTVNDVRNSSNAPLPAEENSDEFAFPLSDSSSLETASPLKIESPVIKSDSPHPFITKDLDSSSSEISDVDVVENAENFAVSKDTPTRKKKSVFASQENFNYSDQSFLPFTNSVSISKNKPFSPQIKVPKLNLEYTVESSDDSETNEIADIQDDPLNLIVNDDKTDTNAKMLLDIRLHDARGTVDMITKNWSERIESEKEEGKLRLQQLEAHYQLQLRHKKVKSADGATIYRPTVMTAPGGKRNDFEKQYKKDKKLLINTNKQRVSDLTEQMKRELERPNAKIKEIENEYRRLGFAIPSPPVDKHSTRPRRNTSRMAPKQ